MPPLSFPKIPSVEIRAARAAGHRATSTRGQQAERDIVFHLLAIGLDLELDKTGSIASMTYGTMGEPRPVNAFLCLSEFKLARTDDEVRREMA
jgi:hypothetical protein